MNNKNRSPNRILPMTKTKIVITDGFVLRGREGVEAETAVMFTSLTNHRNTLYD